MAPPVTNAQPDSYFIGEVRRILRDQLVFTNEAPSSDASSGALGVAASKPLRLQRAPVARTLPAIAAPAPANSPGFAFWALRFDPTPPDFQPMTFNPLFPSISDGGVGTLLAGNYQVAYGMLTATAEVGMSAASPSLTLAANRSITFGALTGFSAGITGLRAYIVSSTGSNVGILGTIPVTAGVSAVTTFTAPPTGAANVGVLPVMVISDTGELFFPTAPASGSIAIQYQTSRFSDQQITEALYEGLDMLWPEIWNYAPFDTSSVQPNPIQWEYALPVAFQDQRAVLMEVEWRPPSAFIIYRRISGWRQVNDVVNPLLVFEKPPPVGGQVRLQYAVPIATLGGVPSIAQFLPVYYAVARLLADQEVMRSRADDLPALTGENAGSQPGTSTNTSAWYMQNMFAPALRKLSLGPPARRSIMGRTIERLGLTGIWAGAA